MGKAFEKQIKTIEDQGQKQVDTLKDLKPKDKKEKEIQANEDKSDDHDDKLSMQKRIFELSTEKMGEIYSMSKQIDFNDLVYCFKSKSITPINFIGFKAPFYTTNFICLW